MRRRKGKWAERERGEQRKGQRKKRKYELGDRKGRKGGEEGVEQRKGRKKKEMKDEKGMEG